MSERLSTQIVKPIEGKIYGEYSDDEEFDGFTIMGEAKSSNEMFRNYMNSSIIGQPHAIESMVRTIDAAQFRTKSERGPAATILCLGPTGVGKTEFARATADGWAKMLGLEEGNLIKIDGSDFQHGHEVSKLTGSPPGYVGAEIKPMLSRKNIEKPATVVLVDEFEKGHEDLKRLFLHIMDDGRLHLNNGKVVNFRDVILIMTGNVGGAQMNKILSGKGLGFAPAGQTTNKKTLDAIVLNEFKSTSSPEFSNRFTDKIVFNALGREELGTVLDTKIAKYNEEYVDDYGVRVVLSNATREHLLDTTMLHSEFAGRELMRVLKQHVLTDLGRYIGGNHVTEGTLVQVFHRDEPVIQRQISDDDPREYIFAQRHDETIRKKRVPVAELPTPKEQKTGTELVEFSDKPVNP